MGRSILKNNPRKFAILRLGGWADTVRLSFMVGAIKERYPDAEVTLIVGKGLKDWAYCTQFDHHVFLNTKNLHSRFVWMRFFKHVYLFFVFLLRRFDVAINLHDSMNFGWTFRLSGTSFVVGIRNPKSKLVFRNSGCHAMLEKKQDEGQLDFLLRIMKEIEVQPTSLKFNVKVRESTHTLTMKRLKIFEMLPKNYLVVGPGEGEAYPRHFQNKKWPFYNEFLREFLEKSTWPILLLGEVSDGNLVLPLIELYRHRIHSWVAQATREQMVVALNQAGAYVGCDSGLSHLAGCVGLPSIVLFGPSKSTQVQPPGLGKTLTAFDGAVPCSPCYKVDGNYDWSCRDNVCMKSISPGQVISELQAIVPGAFQHDKAHRTAL